MQVVRRKEPLGTARLAAAVVRGRLVKRHLEAAMAATAEMVFSGPQVLEPIMQAAVVVELEQGLLAALVD